jgi:hypothetical protein
MNVQRFFGLPNVLKPINLLILLLVILLKAVAPLKQTAVLSFNWFFWLNVIIQLVFMVVVCGLFLYDAESLLTFGRDAWPILEMSYSVAFCICNIINTFLLASWLPQSTSGVFVAASMGSFALFLLYGLGGIMMYRIWRGFVKSGASQNPPPNVQPGDIGGMNPGI